MMKITLILITLLSASLNAHAQEKALRFSHDDWELVCDNARTCRAAGYSEDGADLPASILFTRAAGAGQKVTGQVNLLESPSKPILYINDKNLGAVSKVKDEQDIHNLSDAQVAALIAAAPKAAKIEFVAGDERRLVSDKGAAAVLLKMDDYQKRVGTTSALIKKGSLSDANVLPALPLPVVRAAPVAETSAAEKARLVKKYHAQWRQWVEGSKALKELCDALKTDEQSNPSSPVFEVERLNAQKLLLSTRCWTAAYNGGTAYVVVDDAPKLNPVVVTTDGTDYVKGQIFVAHKGRGMGDCWYADEWMWDGRRFVHTKEFNTGQCKGFAGGAWTLPTLKTMIKK
ncbi:MAG: DUF1176 domain-containing protein [Formosimonas sp.]